MSDLLLPSNVVGLEGKEDKCNFAQAICSTLHHQMQSHYIESGYFQGIKFDKLDKEQRARFNGLVKNDFVYGLTYIHHTISKGALDESVDSYDSAIEALTTQGDDDTPNKSTAPMKLVLNSTPRWYNKTVDTLAIMDTLRTALNVDIDEIIINEAKTQKDSIGIYSKEVSEMDEVILTKLLEVRDGKVPLMMPPLNEVNYTLDSITEANISDYVKKLNKEQENK